MLATIARVIEQKRLERLEPMAARQGVAANYETFECQHTRPFEAGEDWICLACDAIPPTHVEMLQRQRDHAERKRAREAAMLKEAARDIERRAGKQRRKGAA